MAKSRFIAVINKELGLKNSEYAEMAAEAVLKTLHERLTEDQAEQIENHLPKELKLLWSRSLTDRLLVKWHGPEKMTKKQFLDRVQSRAHLKNRAETEQLTEGVFKALKKQVPREQVNSVATHLPRDLKNLWKVL